VLPGLLRHSLPVPDHPLLNCLKVTQLVRLIWL
jgi:hypothetical protein